MRYIAPVYLRELCVAVLQHTEIVLSARVQQRTKVQLMVDGNLLYPVTPHGTRFRCRVLINLSVSDGFEVVSRWNYLIELMLFS